MPSSAIPNCIEACAEKLGIRRGTGESEKCYGCRREAAAKAAPKNSVNVSSSAKKREAMTNYRQ